MFGRIRRVTARRRAWVQVEPLEARTILSIFTPLQIRHAYGFDQVSFTANGQTIPGDGRGQTIAIVDAFADATVAADLDVFDKQFSVDGVHTLYSQYGPASSVLTIATPQGQPSANKNWALETALDVEWAHAIAPAAHILLVEVPSAGFTNLMAGVDYARNQKGVVAVSMSWGSSEFTGENSLDSHYLTPTGHLGGTNGQGGANLPGGVTFVASSGDSGAPPEWPAISPNVLAVGGTSLTLDSSGNYSSETGWSGSGGGTSTIETEPTYQNGVQTSGKRTNPDVADIADPNTGVYVYINKLWYQVGGTSAGAPQWAALIAIADQGRALAGNGSLDGFTQTLPAIYNLPAGDFHDITSGNNGSAAGAGYDLVTGRGSPLANLVIGHLLTTTSTGGVTINATKTTTSTSGSTQTTPHLSEGTPVLGTAVVVFSASHALPAAVGTTVSVAWLPPPNGSASSAAAVPLPGPSPLSRSGQDGSTRADEALPQRSEPPPALESPDEDVVQPTPVEWFQASDAYFEEEARRARGVPGEEGIDAQGTELSPSALAALALVLGGCVQEDKKALPLAA